MSITVSSDDVQTPEITSVVVTGPLTAVISYTSIENANEYIIEGYFVAVLYILSAQKKKV